MQRCASSSRCGYTACSCSQGSQPSGSGAASREDRERISGAVGRAYRTAVNASISSTDRGTVVGTFDVADGNANGDAFISALGPVQPEADSRPVVGTVFGAAGGMDVFLSLLSVIFMFLQCLAVYQAPIVAGMRASRVDAGGCQRAGSP